MKKLSIIIFLAANFLMVQAAHAYNNIWQQVSNTNVPSKGAPVMHPTSFLAYTLNESYLKGLLFGLSTDPAQGTIIELPMPDGSFRSFNVWQTPIMPGTLAEKYNGIKTFTATQVGNQTITAKLDFTVYGFHAMIFDGANTAFIDPYSRTADGVYIFHYKKDEVKDFNKRMACKYKGKEEINDPAGESMVVKGTELPKLTALSRTVNAYSLRTYRLALACSHQYADAATGIDTPSKAQVFSAMTTSMNRINGVYEREFSITMTFIANEDTLIFTTANNDPYDSINSDPGSLIDRNQIVCDDSIGNANYDIGHVFTTAGGGLTGAAGVVCRIGFKAKCETGLPNPVGDGFDIDYVAHEMGHEFGANHTFNNDVDGSCVGNAWKQKAYEPGSGSTIMAYANICSPDDIQVHSDPYFHAASLVEIINYNTTGSGGTCPVLTPTNNYLVNLDTFTKSYTIPYKTPFELNGPTAADSTADTAITYCWEEWNLGGSQNNGGDYGKELINTHKRGPIFRSYNPVYAPLRVFPKVPMVLSGVLSNAGIEDNEGEKAADTARFLTFKMSVRAVLNGLGSVVFPDDTIHLDVVSTGSDNNYKGFKVTAPSIAVNWDTGSTQNITWSVAGTDIAPVSCDSVNIYLSVDGGYTWPYYIGTFPNNGSASVVVPAVTAINSARIKVKGAGNVFFNVNTTPFSIAGPTAVNQSVLNKGVNVYPVPAARFVNIDVLNNDVFHAAISDAVGRIVWKGEISGKNVLDIKKWAEGIYNIALTNVNSGTRIIKTLIVQ